MSDSSPVGELFGLARDLTPFEVLGPSLFASSGSGSVHAKAPGLVAYRPVSNLSDAVPVSMRRTSGPRVVIMGQGPEVARVQAVGICVVGLILAFLAMSRRPDGPKTPDVAVSAAVPVREGVATNINAADSSPATAAARSSNRKAPWPPTASLQSRERGDTVHRRNNAGPDVQAAEPLTSTLERLESGMR